MKLREMFKQPKPLRGEENEEYYRDAKDIIAEYNDNAIRALDLSHSRIRKLPPGLPHTMSNDLLVYDNGLSTFDNFPKRFYGPSGIDMSSNNFKSLQGIEKHIIEVTGDDGINLEYNPLKSHLLGLLKIDGLKIVYIVRSHRPNVVTGREAKLLKCEQIINKHLKEPFGNKRVMDAQSEMLDLVGLEEFAQL